MLSLPEYGWTDFSISDAKYPLSYITNVPIDWLMAAVYGLKNWSPFTVYGDCETTDVYCTVTETFCHVIYEGYEETPETYFVSLTMLDFCKALYSDISKDIDAWSDWNHYDDETFRQNYKRKLLALLDELGTLIKKVERDPWSRQY
ncbi:MAG: hypothetical protein IJ774_03635 [Selenomonadaceae bacterium]|nr:hypothetical protein [Selenomonadaceae bacterium]